MNPINLRNIVYTITPTAPASLREALRAGLSSPYQGEELFSKLMHYRNYFFPIFIIALFLAQFFFISPVGEFALNDDWVHTDTIKHWADTGEFRMLPYAGPTFYVPILYGTALTKLFGFSFTLLRLSTLVLALATLLLLYWFLVRLTQKPALAFVGALTLWLNPLFYNLSFTFMTDTPALFLLLAALVCYFQAFKTHKPHWLFWGSLLSVVGFYTRQTNILLLVAAGLFALRDIKYFSLKHILWSFGVPIVLGIGVYVFLLASHLLPQNTDAHVIERFGRTLGHIKWWAWYTPMYLGLLLLPFTLPWFLKNKPLWKHKTFWALLLVIGAAMVLIRQLLHLQFPYVGNVIHIYGLGPLIGSIAGAPQILFPSWFWGLVTAAAALGFALGVFFFLQNKQRHPPLGFLSLFAVLYCIPLLLFESFDRYFLPLILILIILVVQKIQSQKFSYAFCVIIISIIGLYSISQTHHYLAWNAARWELADERYEAATVGMIDGGYEWLGWHEYWLAYASGIPPAKKIWPGEKWWIRGLFTNNTEEYVVSVSPLGGYNVIQELQLHVANPNRHVFLQKKQANKL